MAGYYIYSIDAEIFEQLTTNPTEEQAQTLAENFIERDLELDDECAFKGDVKELTGTILKRLASDDWYSDLSYADGLLWEEIIESLTGPAGEKLGITRHWDTDYDCVYWDVCKFAAKHGATTMAEPTFGNNGFRFFGQPTNEFNLFPMHSIHSPSETKALLKQLQKVEVSFADEDEGMQEEFEIGLMLPVKIAAQNGRFLWVKTDT